PELKDHDCMTGATSNWPISKAKSLIITAKSSFGHVDCSSDVISPTAISPTSRPGARQGRQSRHLSASKATAGRSRTALRLPRTSSGSTTTNPDRGMAGIVTSRSSCSHLPRWLPSNIRPSSRRPKKQSRAQRPDIPPHPLVDGCRRGARSWSDFEQNKGGTCGRESTRKGSWRQPGRGVVCGSQSDGACRPDQTCLRTCSG